MSANAPDLKEAAPMTPGSTASCTGLAVEVVELDIGRPARLEPVRERDSTVCDLVADGTGATAGAGLLVFWTTRGWGSARRIPGENRREATDASS